jgi:hypothetical protein
MPQVTLCVSVAFSWSYFVNGPVFRSVTAMKAFDGCAVRTRKGGNRGSDRPQLKAMQYREYTRQINSPFDSVRYEIFSA